LRYKFFEAANEAYLYKKPFKNPLTNKDVAWLYEVASRPARLLSRIFLAKDPPDLAADFLRDIDAAKKKMSENNIPVD
jgi:hypothetical protein